MGREIARRTRRPFVDVPTELAVRRNSLTQKLRVFRSEPNPGELEARLITDLSYHRESIIALAADTLENPDCRADLEIFSFIVFLDPPFDVLWSRLQACRRPPARSSPWAATPCTRCGTSAAAATRSARYR